MSRVGQVGHACPLVACYCSRPGPTWVRSWGRREVLAVGACEHTWKNGAQRSKGVCRDLAEARGEVDVKAWWKVVWIVEDWHVVVVTVDAMHISLKVYQHAARCSVGGMGVACCRTVCLSAV